MRYSAYGNGGKKRPPRRGVALGELRRGFEGRALARRRRHRGVQVRQPLQPRAEVDAKAPRPRERGARPPAQDRGEGTYAHTAQGFPQERTRKSRPRRVPRQAAPRQARRPKEKSFDVFNINAGYKYKPESKVIVKIGNKTFDKLFTNEDQAWTVSDNVDRELVKEMKRGSRMIVHGTSFKGTKTKDTYSLAGFSSAYKAISSKCKR